jgi:hypothetical protein
MEALRMNTNNPSWWRFGHVWLLIAGPALVIVAGLVTAWIAVSHPDPVLTDGDHRQDLVHSQSQAQGQSQERSLVPAQQARNHAATPADTPMRRAP